MGASCIDISYAQGNNINFRKVKASGVTAVIIRIGYGREVSQKDSCFERNYREAKAVGIKVGGYWYSYADSVADAGKEAQACLKCINNKHFDLPIYYDMEESSQAASHSATTLTNMAKAFCNAIKRGGYSAGVYSNPNWFINHLHYSELRKLYSIWLAQWGSQRSYDCDIWQYSSTGRVDGISVDVDENVILNSSFSGSSGSTSSETIATDVVTNVIDASLIDYEALDPYIVTIDRNTKSVNYSALKDLGVSGVMIEAGVLYDSAHQEISYRNPQLDTQAHAASDADVPFALYTDVRSKSVDEAKKELYELSFCVRRYPPALGVWLRLNLTKSKSVNNKIIDTYYTELVKLGLKGKIGFYATESQLDKIDWRKYSEDWYLWLDKHVSRMGDIDQLLTPEFFVLGGR